MDSISAHDLIAPLEQIVGKGNVLPQAEARRTYANDQWWYAIAAALRNPSPAR